MRSRWIRKAGVFVADRSNGRIQIFDQDGGFIAQWEHFGAPQGIAITPDDTMFVSSGPMITIASAKDGSVLGTITEGRPGGGHSDGLTRQHIRGRGE